MSNSITSEPTSPDSATHPIEPERSKLARVRQGLRGVLFPSASPVGLTGEGSGKAPNVQALELEMSWLKMQLAQYRKEQGQFEGLEPFVLGTEHVSGIVPPIAGAGVRATVGSPSMAGYLVSGDAWQILISKFLKPNSQVLDIGCGCGKMARNLAYHPHIKKFIGFDVIQDSIDYCNQTLVPRIGSKFEFHCYNVYSECYNPQGTIKASELVFPATDGSIDLAWGCSLFTHLLEPDAKHYLREVRRVLSPSGMFLPTIHINPAPGTRYSGNEVRVDIDIDYFAELAAEAGLSLAVKLGEVCGQYALLFKVAPGAEAPKIVNVNGTKSEAEVAEASKPKTGGVPVPPNEGALTGEMLRLNGLAAEKEGVTPDVHPKDFIFWFVATHPELSLDSATTYYFEDGARSADKLDKELTSLFGEEKKPIKLLEFASGYGCVSRHLKKNPRFDLTSCDIHPEAIDFLTNKIGVKALQSAHTPEKFSTPEKYDAIFALSFFSHMPKATFGRWIKALYNSLNAPGYLLFTTHGIKSIGGLQITAEDIPADGFWFQARSEQHDLDAEEYGLTLSLPNFVIPEVHRVVGSPIANYKQAEWWFHQDLWIVKRER
ncbi:methyltransferase domain-containing protein [Paludisphaera borealis]|uniref:Ribosomal RNA small subunit methyltransferase C n=1 Tax=Paludisphaera borealis TaxID=1387353 RepID=A0A1U7CMX2_9BACT|nr:methyltransferase domain-containing protein [Paludisphaera borealis]APW60258.1 Ribosomal RNA small subunit methyltransferase C [Paludisphaera borealis]